MQTPKLTLRRPGVAQVTMARPAVFNAFDEAMSGELDAAFAQLIEDEAARVVVLAGEGNHFSAGADLQWMQRASLEWHVADARRFAGMLAGIASSPKPAVARIHGAALGGGAGLASACDTAIAADSANFSVSEARFGILPAVIGPYVTHAVGTRQAQWQARQQARQQALTTERLNAADALAMGLVQRVVGPDDLDAAVDDTVQQLLAGGPNAQREIEALFAQLPVGPVTPETIELAAQTIARVRGSDEVREGFSAFLSKRPAKWTPT